jgi:hypothetical protein
MGLAPALRKLISIAARGDVAGHRAATRAG